MNARWFSVLQRASAVLARIEVAVAGVCLAAVFLLLVINILTRSMGNALYWVDEAAVFAMVWMTFFAASASLHKRTNIAVTLAFDRLDERARRCFAALVDGLLLLFVVVFFVLAWRWFAPHHLIAAGGDLQTFASNTFNFMYEEPTQTLGVRKAWLWAVIPVFAVCAMLHCLANLGESLAALVGQGRAR